MESFPWRVLTISPSDRHRRRAGPFSDCTHVSGPSIELSRDSLDATGQVIEPKLSRHRLPILFLSFLFLPFFPSNDATRGMRAKRRKKNRQRGGKRRKRNWKVSAGSCRRPATIIIIGRHRSIPPPSAFNLRSSIGLLGGNRRMARN